MPDVVIDTNVMLQPFTEGLPLIDELERLLGAVRPVVAGAVETELTSLATGRDATGRAASGALRLSRAWAHEPSALPGDDGVLEVARRLQAAIATNDKAIQKEAAKDGLIVVAPRGKGQLMIIGR